MTRPRTFPAFVFGAALSVACGCGGSTSPGQPIVVEAPAPEALPGSETTPDPHGSEPETSTGTCEQDSDCVPAGCCHSRTCTPRAQAPDCSDVMCTQDCQFGTLDCGGSCVCTDGRCDARLSEAPAIAAE